MTFVRTYTVRVYMAGDIETAKRWLRRECWREGLCVTVEPTTFIYTGGEETGFVVGLLNYPRFPTDHGVIKRRAYQIAEGLRDECCQRSALVVAPDGTEWLIRDTPPPVPVQANAESPTATSPSGAEGEAPNPKNGGVGGAR